MGWGGPPGHRGPGRGRHYALAAPPRRADDVQVGIRRCAFEPGAHDRDGFWLEAWLHQIRDPVLGLVVAGDVEQPIAVPRLGLLTPPSASPPPVPAPASLHPRP